MAEAEPHFRGSGILGSNGSQSFRLAPVLGLGKILISPKYEPLLHFSPSSGGTRQLEVEAPPMF